MGLLCEDDEKYNLVLLYIKKLTISIGSEKFYNEAYDFLCYRKLRKSTSPFMLFVNKKNLERRAVRAGVARFLL